MPCTTFLWFIENYSYCWHKNGEMLISPKLSADEVERAIWNLILYPRGDYNDAGEMCIYLHRTDDNGPDELPVHYEMSIISEGGSTPFCKRATSVFPKKHRQGFLFKKAVTTFRFAQEEYLPNDTLTIRCKIWTAGDNMQHAAPICARTRIGIEHVSFMHLVKDFTKLEPNVKKSVQIRSRLIKGGSISSSLYIRDGLCPEKSLLILQIKTFGPKYNLSKLKVSAVNVYGNSLTCKEENSGFNATREGIEEFALSISKEAILNMKHEYLPGDRLSLLCDCTFTTGIEYNRLDGGQVEISPTSIMQSRNYPYFTALYTKKLSRCPSIVDDLKDIFLNDSFTDVKFKTKTSIFPAHKAVLCARTPVFRRMFNNDMRKRNSDTIFVDDLEDDTVQHMLMFLYSDQVKNLEWDTACALYYASDKYDIKKLKLLCSTFLVDNLCTSTAIELLLLADSHSDCNLKKVAKDFILEHEEEVFASQEWLDLQEINLQLALMTMFLIFRTAEEDLKRHTRCQYPLSSKL